MNDTTPAAAAMMHKLMMQRTGEERMLMGFSMCECARKMVEAGIKALGLEEGTVEFRREYLKRMYGDELRPDQIEIIAVRGATKR